MVRRRRLATRYANRTVAGRALAEVLLAQTVLETPIVLALPRGGVPVAAEVAARLLDDVIASPTFAPQPAHGVTYAEKITPEDRELDLEQPADELVNRVRALSPYIGARAVLDGRPLLVWKARVGENGAFEPLEVQPEGGRRMTYDEYLRGRR